MPTRGVVYGERLAGPSTLPIEFKSVLASAMVRHLPIIWMHVHLPASLEPSFSGSGLTFTGQYLDFSNRSGHHHLAPALPEPGYERYLSILTLLFQRDELLDSTPPRWHPGRRDFLFEHE